MPFNNAEFEFIFEGEISVLDNVFLNGKMNKLLEVKLVNDIIFCYQNWNIKTPVLNNNPRKLIPISVAHFSKVCDKYPEYKPSVVVSIGTDMHYLLTFENMSYNSSSNTMSFFINENMKSKIKIGELGKGRLNLSTLPFGMLNFDSSLNELAEEQMKSSVGNGENDDDDDEETPSFSFLYQDTGDVVNVNEKEMHIKVRNPKIVIAYQQWSRSTPNLNERETRQVSCLDFDKMVENAKTYNNEQAEKSRFTPTTTLIIDEKIFIGVITDIVEDDDDETAYTIIINKQLIDKGDLDMEIPAGNNIDFFMNIDDTPSNPSIITVEQFISQHYRVLKGQKLIIPDVNGDCFVPEDLNFDNYRNDPILRHLDNIGKSGSNSGTITLYVDSISSKNAVKPNLNYSDPVRGNTYTLSNYHVVTFWIREVMFSDTNKYGAIQLADLSFYNKDNQKIEVLNCEKYYLNNDDGTANELFVDETGPEGLEKLCDGDNSTKWFSGDTMAYFIDQKITVGTLSFTLSETPYYYTFRTASDNAQNDRMILSWTMKNGNHIFEENHKHDAGFKKGDIRNNTTYPLDQERYRLHPNAVVDDEMNALPSSLPGLNEDNSVIIWFKELLNAQNGIELSQIYFYDENDNQINITGVDVYGDTNPDGTPNTIEEAAIFNERLFKMIDGDTSTKWYSGFFKGENGTVIFKLEALASSYTFRTANDNLESGRMPLRWQVVNINGAIDENHAGEDGYTETTIMNNTIYPQNDTKFMLRTPIVRETEEVDNEDEERPPLDEYDDNAETIVLFEIRKLLISHLKRPELALRNITFYDKDNNRIDVKSVDIFNTHNKDGSVNHLKDYNPNYPLSNLIDYNNDELEWWSVDNSIPIDENLDLVQWGTGYATSDKGGTLKFVLDKKPYFYTFETGRSVGINKKMMVSWKLTVNNVITSENHENEFGYSGTNIPEESVYPLDGSKFAIRHSDTESHNTYNSTIPYVKPKEYGIPYQSKFVNGEKEYINTSFFLIPEWLQFINYGTINIIKKFGNPETELFINDTHDKGNLTSFITVAKPSRQFLTRDNWEVGYTFDFTSYTRNEKGFGFLLDTNSYPSDNLNEYPCFNYFANEGVIELYNDLHIQTETDFSILNAVINQNGGIISIPKIVNYSTVTDVTVSGIRELINTENFQSLYDSNFSTIRYSFPLYSRVVIDTVNSHSPNCITCGILNCYINQGYINIDNIIAGNPIADSGSGIEDYVIPGYRNSIFDFNSIYTYGIQNMGVINVNMPNLDADWGLRQEVLRIGLQSYKNIAFKHKMINPLKGYGLTETNRSSEDDIEDIMGNTGIIKISNILNFSNQNNKLSNEVSCGILNLIQPWFPESMGITGYYKDELYGSVPNALVEIFKVINYGYGGQGASLGVKNVLVNYGSIKIDILDNKSPIDYVVNSNPPVVIGIENVVQNGFAFKNPEEFSHDQSRGDDYWKLNMETIRSNLTADPANTDYSTSYDTPEAHYSQRSFLPPFPPQYYDESGIPILKENFYGGGHSFIVPWGDTGRGGKIKYDQGHISIGLVNNSHQTANLDMDLDAETIGVMNYGGLSFRPQITEYDSDVFYSGVEDITSYMHAYITRNHKLATMWAFPTSSNVSEDSALAGGMSRSDLFKTPYYENYRNPVAMYYKYLKEGSDELDPNSKIFFPMNWGIVTINSIHSGLESLPLEDNNCGTSLGIKHLTSSLGSIQILSITSKNPQVNRKVNTTRVTKVNTPDNPELSNDLGYNDYRELPLRYSDYEVVHSINDENGNVITMNLDEMITLPRGHINNVLDDRIHEDKEGINIHYQSQMIGTTGSGNQCNQRFPYGIIENSVKAESKYRKIDEIDKQLTTEDGDNVYKLLKCKGMSCGVLRVLNYGSEAPGLWMLTDFSQPFVQSHDYEDYRRSFTKRQYARLFRERFGAAAAGKDIGYYRMPAINTPYDSNEEKNGPSDFPISWFGETIDDTDYFDLTEEDPYEVPPFIVNNSLINELIRRDLFEGVSLEVVPSDTDNRFYNGAALFPYITRERIGVNDQNFEIIYDKLTENGFRTDQDILFTDADGDRDMNQYPLRPWSYQTLQTHGGYILDPIFEWEFRENVDDTNNLKSRQGYVAGCVPENNHMSMWPQFTNELLAGKEFLGWDYSEPPESEKYSGGYLGPKNCLNTVSRGVVSGHHRTMSVDNFFRYQYNANFPPGFNPQFIQGGQLSFPDLNRTNKDYVFQYGILKFDDTVLYADAYRWDGFATVSLGKKFIAPLNSMLPEGQADIITYYKQKNTHDDHAWFPEKFKTGNTYYNLLYENKNYQGDHEYRLHYGLFGPHSALGKIIQYAGTRVFTSFKKNEQLLIEKATSDQLKRQKAAAEASIAGQITGSVIIGVGIAYAGGIVAAGIAVQSAIYYGLGWLVCCCTIS